MQKEKSVLCWLGNNYAIHTFSANSVIVSPKFDRFAHGRTPDGSKSPSRFARHWSKNEHSWWSDMSRELEEI